MQYFRILLVFAAMLATTGCIQTGMEIGPPAAGSIDAVVYDSSIGVRADVAMAQPPVVAPAPPPPEIAPPPPVLVSGPPVPPPLPPSAVPLVGIPEQLEPPYTLDSGDKLRVIVFGQDGLSNIYSVDSAGRISMPLIGAVSARGLTTSQLAGAVAARLRNGFLREPHVAIEVEAYRPFFILGEVTYPGQYPFVAHMTAETAVAIAGGFTPRAYRWDVEVTRPTPEGPVKLKGPPMLLLRPGDTVVIAERWF